MRQYLRHLPILTTNVKEDLFLCPITSPANNVWYNRENKVGINVTSSWLKNMLKLVGLSGELFSNRSGRASLVTRMATKGVPDVISMLITSHHIVSDYGRYDCTKELKMAAATLVSANPRMNYKKALSIVSKDFVAKKLVGSVEDLNPLIAHVSGTSSTIPLAKSLEVKWHFFIL